MYHPTVVEQRLTTMLDAVRRTVPGAEAPARTLAEVAEWDARLSTAWDPDTKTAKRPLDDEEQRFILGEKLRSKADWRYCAERYFKIRDEGGSLITIPLRRTQEIILRKLGEMEASTAARNDGVLALVLKARQLGVSTLTELLIAHKALFYSHRHCLIASDIPENSAYLFDMIERVYENLPWWLQPTKTEHVKNDEIVFGKIDTRIKVGWGNATRGQRGTARARLGQGTTINAFHGSELATWTNGKQIDSSVTPALPRHPNTFGLLESTALGRGNWWHDAWTTATKGLGRWRPIFIPWCIEVEKYSVPPPASWTPSDITTAHAARVTGIARDWCGITMTLTPGQMYWYETMRAEAIQKRMLPSFAAEYAADPDECFQNSGQSVFSIEMLNGAAQRLKTLAGLADITLDPTVDWARRMIE
mgnify:CR=1 FL=1